MDTLPQEVLLHILSFLPTTEDLLRAESVESRWFHLLRNDDAGTWRRMYERDFGGPVQNKAKKQKVPESWRSRCARAARGVRSKLRQSHLTLEVRNTKLLRWACMFGHHRIIAQLFASGAVPRDQLAPDALTQDTKRTAIFPLHLAAASGGALAVEEVLKAGFAVGQRNASGATAIGIAAQMGSMDVVEVLLRHGAETGGALGSLQAKGKNALPLLHQAASQGHKEIVRAVLEHMSDCDQDKFKALVNSAESRQGNTPLHLAAGGGHDETVVFLLDQGADQNASNLMGHKALHLATSLGRVSTVRLLLSRGAAENLDPRSPFLLACELQLAEIVDVFLEHGFDINSNDEGQNPLLVALRSRHTRASFIEFLLARGADLEVRFKSARDLLLSMIEWSPDKIDTLSMLIDRLGPVDDRIDLLEEAAAAAARRRLPESSCLELFEMLLGKGIALPLHNTNLLAKAVPSKKIGFIQYLLDKGIHVDAHKEDGSTALYESVYYAVMQHEEGRGVFQFLLEKGADPNITCGWRKDTAIHWACSLGCNPSIIQLLVEHGADINKRAADGCTPLFKVLANVFSHSDAKHAYPELARALVRMGADPKLCVDSEGLDPYQWVHSAPTTKIPPSALQLAEELGVAINTSQPSRRHIDHEDEECEDEETRE